MIHAALDRRLERDIDRPVAVALSGGGDSVALLVETLRWAQGARRPVLALTVDHRLHPDSSRWTAEAGALARRLGADWRPLAWIGDKPATGLPAAARRARHALLADAARTAGARVLLMGHTADDVAESRLIREITPAHGRLRTWAPSPAWPQGRGVFLLRPLLQSRRAALRDRLRFEGVPWLEDPSNADARFARSRARAALADVAAISPPDSGESATANGAFVAHDDASVTLLGRPDAELLAKALLCAGGGERPPRRDSLLRLLARLGAEAPAGAVLAGARVECDGPHIRVFREPGEQRRAQVEAIPLLPAVPVVFDGRFEIESSVAELRVEPLAGHAAGLSSRERTALRAVPAAVRPSLPALLDPAGRPHLPTPFGHGQGRACSLVGARLAAACGQVRHEAEVATHRRDPPAHSVDGAQALVTLS